MREMLEAMRAGGDAETLRAIAAEPEVESPFVADPESPAAVKLAEEIWRDTVEEKSRQARGEAHERELDAQLKEDQRKLRPEYCGCSHPFKYGGVEVSEMKKPSVHEQVGLIKEELRDRKVLLNPGDFSKLPQFLDMYVELFGGSEKRGESGRVREGDRELRMMAVGRLVLCAACGCLLLLRLLLPRAQTAPPRLQ